MIRTYSGLVAVSVAVILFFAFGIGVTVGVWNECRADHSFFYCLRLVSR